MSARRIDRQLYGRAGRQGDPGSYEAVVSLEDDLIATSRRRVWRWIAAMLAQRNRPVGGKLAVLVAGKAQASAERLHARIRRDLLQSEDQLESALAFSGRME